MSPTDPEVSAAEEFDLAEAYAVATPDDNRALYRKWAASYEDGFLVRRGYIYHHNVARILLAATAAGPVLDVGCGTGIVGEVLAAAGVGPIDGVDISPEMLAKAADKTVASGAAVYRSLIEADLTKTIALPDNSYQAIISVGTFTFGHLPPSSLAELFRVAAPGAAIAVGINSGFFAEAGFETWLGEQAAAGTIGDYELTSVAMYSASGDAESRDDHGDDQALVLSLTMP